MNKSGTGNSNYIHGQCYTRLHCIWLNMKQRCRNSSQQAYKNYGKRGIKVCDEWFNDFVVFRDWAMDNGYADDLQIDRIDNDGNYEPSNCHFVTCAKNNRNKRNNKLNQVSANQIREFYEMGWWTQNELAKEFGVSRPNVGYIIRGQYWS